MPNAMHGISRFEDAVKLLDEKDATIARLQWIIGIVRQDLAENAPGRAKVFLDHQMREPQTAE